MSRRAPGVGGEGGPPEAGDPGEESGRSRDVRRMRRALREARAGAARGEVPVGAVLELPGADGSRVVVADHNRTRELSDPTAHAEMLAIREAAAHRGDWRLTGGTLYVTLEPCAMCAGAAVLARLDRVVFGAADPKSGMAGTLENLLQDPRLNHRTEVTSGVLADACAGLLKDFFAVRRGGDPGALDPGGSAG